MRTRVRHVAKVNPLSRRFDRLPDDELITFLPMENVWPGDKLDLTQVRPKSSVATGYTRFESGDVLVPKITPTFEAGRSVLIPDIPHSVGAGTTELHVVRPCLRVDPRFLLYIFLSHDFLKVGESELYGVAGQKRVPDDLIKNWIIDLPSLDEQRRIADFLDAEAARIDHLSALQASVLQTLNQRDQAIRDTLLGELIDQVGELPLRRYSSWIEQGTSPSCENHPREGNGWGVLKLSAVKQGRFFSEENKQLPDEIEPIRECEVREGDLLVTRANTPDLVGDVAVVTDVAPRLLLPDLIYRVGLDRRIKAQFAAQVFLSTRVRGLIQSTARGSSQSMVKLRGEDIREWPVPRASMGQQSDFISEIEGQLESSERLRATIHCQLSLLAERRQALITAAVAGEITV